MDINFGGISDLGSSRSCTSAYMVVYVRDAEINDVLCEVKDSDVNKLFLHHLERERKAEARLERLSLEAVDNICVKVFGNDEMGAKTCELGTPDVDNMLIPKEYRVPRGMMWSEFASKLVDCTGWQEGSFRLWLCVYVNRSYLRMDCIYPLRQEGETKLRNMKDAINFAYNPHRLGGNLHHDELYIYMERSNAFNQPLPYLDYERKILMFVKEYDAEQSKLIFKGHMFVDFEEDLCESIARSAKRLLQIPDEAWIWADIRSERLLLLHGNDLCLASEKLFPHGRASLIQTDGFSVVVQRAQPPEVLNNLPYPRASDYCADLVQRLKIDFYDKDNTQKVEYSAYFNQKTSFVDVVEELARHLGVDNPTKIQLYRLNVQNGISSVIRTRGPGTVKIEDSLAHVSPQETNWNRKTRR